MSALQITNQELQTSFDFSEAFVNEMKTKADALMILGVDDKEGYNAVNDARKLIKEKRVQVEKKRNELNADALAYQRTVNTEAKRITSMLEPIEQKLADKTKAIDAEKERIKLEDRRLRQEKTAGRIGQMVSMNMTQIGGMYYVGEQRISHNEVETWEDEIWTDFIHICEREYFEAQRILAEAKVAQEAEAQRIADEAEAERIRLKKIADEQEASARELALIAKEQKAEADRLKKIADEQEAERVRLESIQETERARLESIDAFNKRRKERRAGFGQLKKAVEGVFSGMDFATGPDTSAVHVFDGMAKVATLDQITENRKAMARANAINFLRDKGFLYGSATEFTISFAGNRPPVDLVELMGDFLAEFWSVPL